MAYLDNSTEITIDATLTRKGREMLSMGQNLAITKFALADDEIDYTLYDPAHPKGSAFYDSAILALPILEASVDETQMLRHKLMTMPRAASGANILIPIIRVNGNNNTLLTGFTIYAGEGEDIIEPVLVSLTSVPTTANSTFTIILNDSDAGTIGGVTQQPTANGSEVRSVTFTNVSSTFQFAPNTDLLRSVSTTLTIIGDQTGATMTLPVKITYVRE